MIKFNIIYNFIVGIAISFIPKFFGSHLSLLNTLMIGLAIGSFLSIISIIQKK